ncbi:MAG TPA: hypothetical protein VIH27_03595 [Nitrososphaerales archaeon]
MAIFSGRDRVSIPGVSTMLLNRLAQHDILSFEDLARTDPNNSRLRLISDKLEVWINYARKIIAEEVIRDISVGRDRDTISVKCSKVYDVFFTLETVKVKLEIYEYYVDVDRRVSDKYYEFIFSINKEHRQYASGSWYDYVQRAESIKMLTTTPKVEEPLKEDVKEIPFNELLSLFAPEVLNLGDVPLLKEVLLHLLFADRLNVLVSAPPSISAKTSLGRALQSYASASFSHTCGSRLSVEELANRMCELNEGVVLLQGLDSTTAEEKTVLSSMLSLQKVEMSHRFGEDFPTKISFYAQTNASENKSNRKTSKKNTNSLIVDSELLQFFHCVVLASQYSITEFETISRFILKASSNTGDDLKKLNIYLQKARSIQPKHDGPPEEVYDFLKNIYKQREKIVIPVTPEIGKGVIEIAKAHSRIRLSPRVTREDFLYALGLVQSCLKTCGFQPVEKKE